MRKYFSFSLSLEAFSTGIFYCFLLTEDEFCEEENVFAAFLHKYWPSPGIQEAQYGSSEMGKKESVFIDCSLEGMNLSILIYIKK